MITSFSLYLLNNRGLSQATVDSYCDALRCFAQFINNTFSGLRWTTVQKNHIDQYVVWMVAKGYSAASVKQHISALRTFFKTCMALGKMSENPARYVSTPKLSLQLPKIIEVSAIKAALQSATVSAQAKAAIAIIFETGVRLQELLDMRPGDINSAEGSITVRGKGRKERTVYYGELCRKYGRCWHGAEHNQREVRRMVFNALRPYSKAEQLSPHALRHTFASQLLNNGMSIEAISHLLGHEHVETTEIYAQLSNKTVSNMYQQFAPRVS